MDKSEKRRLKKLGKELVEQRSAELQKALHESNPAPLGSDEWMENYKATTQNEKWLRKALPILHKSEWEKMFVVRVDHAPGSTVVQKYEPAMGEDGRLRSSVSRLYAVGSSVETYVQCQLCESVISYMRPPELFYWKKCLCGNATRMRFLFWYSLKFREENKVLMVRLIGKGSAQTKSEETEP